MPSAVTPVETELIHAYRCARDAPERATIIHRYAGSRPPLIAAKAVKEALAEEIDVLG